MTIKRRAILIGSIFIGLLLLQTLSAAWNDYRRAQTDAQGEVIVSMLRNHMVGDMMHDAVRGAVYAALYGAAIEDPAVIGKASDDLDEYAANYREIMAANLKLAVDPEMQAQLAATNKDVETYLSTGRSMIDAARRDRAAAERGFPQFNASFDTLEASMEKIGIRFEELLAARNAATRASTMWTLIVLTLVSCAVLAVTMRKVQSLIVLRLYAITDRFKAMAQGDYTSPVTGTDVPDEIGEIARAAEHFREVALAGQSAEREQQVVVAALAAGLQGLAARDLTQRIETRWSVQYETLRENFNATARELAGVMQQVAIAAESVSNGAEEIHSASSDLARRNELQAARVDETSTTLGEVAANVQSTAANAAEVQRVIASARKDVSAGDGVVREAVSTMASIEASSAEVGNIIALIKASADQVGRGVELVGRTGEAFSTITASFSNIEALVGTIAEASQGQADNLQQVSGAASDIGRTTQANAAMVEEATAAASSLARQSADLSTLVAAFRLDAAAAGVSHEPEERCAA